MSAAAHDVDVVKVPEEQFLQVLLRDYGDRFDNEQALDLLIRYLELKILRLELEAGKYDGIIMNRTKYLHEHRPDDTHSWEDILQNQYVEARNAIDLYDQTTGVPFYGFLKHHLYQRGEDWLQYHGYRAKGTKRSKRVPVSEASEPSYQYNIDASLLIEEQLQQLSDQSRDCLERLFRFDDQHSLIAACYTNFGKPSKHRLGKLSKLSGIPRRRLENTLAELQRLDRVA